MKRKGRTSRPSSRMEARDIAKQRRVDRTSQPPTWRGAINRAVIAVAAFFAILVLLLNQPTNEAILIAAFMFLVYIPMGYGMDLMIYRMRQRRRQRERAQEPDQ